MTEIVDLWPDTIKVEKIITPATILRQQASLLGKKTKNILKGEVYDQRLGSDPKSGFRYTFFIVAPALSNYQSRILTIRYGMSIYPVIMYVEDEEICKEIPSHFKLTDKDMGDLPNKGMGDYMRANSEAEFLEVLKAIFNSAKVIRIISVLLSQSDPSYDPSLKEEEAKQ